MFRVGQSFGIHKNYVKNSDRIGKTSLSFATESELNMMVFGKSSPMKYI